MLAEHFFKYGGALGALTVGAVYFVRARQDTFPLRRLLCAAYAPATAVLFLSGVWLAPVWIGLGRSAFSLAQLLIVPFIFYSLVFYPGRRSDHVVLGLFAGFCWFWQFLIGDLLIYGK